MLSYAHLRTYTYEHGRSKVSFTVVQNNLHGNKNCFDNPIFTRTQQVHMRASVSFYAWSLIIDDREHCVELCASDVYGTLV